MIHDPARGPFDPVTPRGSYREHSLVDKPGMPVAVRTLGEGGFRPGKTERKRARRSRAA